MRRILLATAIMTGLLTLSARDASAAPSSGLASIHSALVSGKVTKVSYYWNRRHWRHRRWSGGRWRYW